MSARSHQRENLRTGVILLATFGVMFVGSIVYIMLYH